MGLGRGGQRHRTTRPIVSVNRRRQAEDLVASIQRLLLIDVCRVSIRQSVPLIKAPVWVHIFEEWRIVILHVRFADTVIDGTVQSGDL